MAESTLSMWIMLMMLTRIASAQENVLLLPYGLENGDQVMPDVDDSSVNVTLDFEFPFFDQDHHELFLNDNGVVSFLNKVVEYTPIAFPLVGKRSIAPFWADVDTTVAGEIYYREDRSAAILDVVDQVIRRAFPVRFSRFRSSWTFVATWEQVAFYNNHRKQEPPINNTFQAVLASDGHYSFTIFNYEKIEWTTGLSSFGDKFTGSATNDQSVAAQVGFNAGDGTNYFAVRGSRTEEVRNITHRSNVGIPGRWVFRTDSVSIESAGCDDTGGLKISQVAVNMLGGEILAISGPCFLDTDEISCRIDGVVVAAGYDLEADPLTVHCITPVFMRLGEALVELSVDGGKSFTYNVTVSIVPLDDQPGLLSITEENKITKRISWDSVETPFDLARRTVRNVDIILYGYTEDSAGQVIELGPIRLLKRNARLSDGVDLVDALEMLADGVDVGIVRMVETGTVDLRQDVIGWSSKAKPKRSSGPVNHPAPVPAMWSLPFNMNPLSAHAGSTWCQKWAKRADRVVLQPGDPVVDCPCLINQARGDKGRFEVLPSCLGGAKASARGGHCDLRPDARLCVRARLGSPMLGRGQVCCYDDQSQLINLQDRISGGAVQSRHHFGFHPDYRVGNIPYFSNLLHDTIPWEECCAKTDKFSVCRLYSNLRLSGDCRTYSPPGIASVYGEPHFQSWDNQSFTFNGYGEYQLVAGSGGGSSVNIQTRMVEVVGNSGATGVTAVVSEVGDSDRVQVEVSQRRDINVWVYHRGKGKWDLPSFDRGDHMFAQGVNIEVYRNATDEKIRTGAFVTFDDGSSIEVKMPNGASSLNVLVNLPAARKNTVRGLLGTWDDNNTNDGSVMSQPRPSQPSTPTPDWRIAVGDSILRYSNGMTASDYRTASMNFVPTEVRSVGMGVSEADLDAVCGNSQPCRFDYLKTGDSKQGKNARFAEEEEWETRQGLVGVVSCGFLPPPENGMREGDVYLRGHSVLFVCEEEYILTGSQVRECEPSGTWSGETTYCIEREMLKEVDLLLWVLVGLAAGIMMSLFFCCILLLCCVCRRKRKIREKEKVMQSAYKLEASVISHTNGIMMEESSISDNNNHILTNGHAKTSNGLLSPDVLDNGVSATARRESGQSVLQFAGQMSFAEREAEGVSHAQIRKQSEPDAGHGFVQRTPSFDQASPSRRAPPVAKKPKSRKTSDYKDLPLSHLEVPDEEFRTARIVETENEEGVGRTRRYQLQEPSIRL